MKKLPLARTMDIVVQTLGKEILIYDLNTNKAYNLNETSSIVYQACDGKTTFAELSVENNFTDEIIFLAIDELNKENLLEKNQEYISPFNGLSRREAIRKVGLASMIALPVISSLVAPTAAMAQSAVSCGGFADRCAFGGYTFEGFTQSNCCEGYRCTENSVCISCISSGYPYKSVPSDPSRGLQGDCDTSYEKNLCCDSVNPADFSCGFDTCDCHCP